MVTIVETATQFQVDTDRLRVYIDKGGEWYAGMIALLRLQSKLTLELNDTVELHYNAWYPEYSYGINIGHIPPLAGTVVVTKISDIEVKVVWTTSKFRHTWIYKFEDGKDYFTIEFTRECLSTDVYVNAQLCHMFSPNFNRGGHTDYQGEVIEDWLGVGAKGQRDMNTAMFQFNRGYCPFIWIVDDSNGVALGVAISKITENQYHTMALDVLGRLSPNNTWEFQWNWFGAYGSGGVKIKAGTVYGGRFHIIALQGDENTLKAVAKEIYERFGRIEWVSRDRGYIECGYGYAWKTGYDTKLTAHSGWILANATSLPYDGEKVQAISPFPETETMNNFIRFNVTKGGSTIFPEDKTVSRGTSETDDYYESWFTNLGVTLRFRIHKNDPRTLHIITETPDVEDTRSYLELGIKYPEKYTLLKKEPNLCSIEYDDPIKGKLPFKIRTENATISYGSSTITITPTDSPYFIDCWVPPEVEVPEVPPKIGVAVAILALVVITVAVAVYWKRREISAYLRREIRR